MWPWVVGTLAAAAIALLGLRASGFLKLGGGASDPNLALNGKTHSPNLIKEGKTPDPVLQATAQTAPPILEQGATEVKMPDDVYDWLKWLEQIEKEKQALTGKQMSELMVLQTQVQGASGLTADDVKKMVDPDNNDTTAPAVEKALSMTQRMPVEWQDLQSRFNSKPPPAECAPIAQDYDGGFDAMVDQISGITNILNGAKANDNYGAADAEKDSASLSNIKREHPKSVDAEFRDTDNLVQQICDKYKVHKWFSIDTHGGGDSFLGQFGGL